MIKNIKEMFESIANSHALINSFEYNDRFKIERTGETIYPQLFLEDDPAIDWSTQTLSYTFYLIEMPREDYADHLELQQKLFEINLAIVTKLQLQFRDILISTQNINSIFLKEWEGDNTISLRTEISFTFANLKNNCLEPWL